MAATSDPKTFCNFRLKSEDPLRLSPQTRKFSATSGLNLEVYPSRISPERLLRPAPALKEPLRYIHSHHAGHIAQENSTAA